MTNILTDPAIAEMNYQRGNSLFAAGDLKGAVAAYTAVVRQSPHHASAINNRGAAFAKLGDFSTAFADYETALAIDPQLAAAFNNRAMARFQHGDLAAALRDLRAAIAIDPKYAEAYDNCAMVQTGLYQHAQALVSYDRAIALYSRHPRYSRRLCKAHVLRSLTHYHLHDGTSAANDLRAAYRLDPTTTANLVAELVERNSRDFKAAMISCAQYLARDPGDVFSMFRRALTHLATGDRAAFTLDRAATVLVLPDRDLLIADALADALTRRLRTTSGVSHE